MQLRTGRSRSRRDKSTSKRKLRQENERELQPPSSTEGDVERVFSPRMSPIPQGEHSNTICTGMNQEDAGSYDGSSSSISRKDIRRLTLTSDSGISSRLSLMSGRNSLENAPHSSQGHRRKHSKPHHESNSRKSATLAYDNYSSSESSSPSSSPSLFSCSSKSASSCGPPNATSCVKRTKHKVQESPHCRRQRWLRTADVLKRSGLLDITVKTAELMRENQKIQKEIQMLQKETQKFVSSVLSNPENQHVLQNIQSSAQLFEVVVPGSQNLMLGGGMTESNPSGFSFSKPKSLGERAISPNLFSHSNENNESSFTTFTAPH